MKLKKKTEEITTKMLSLTKTRFVLGEHYLVSKNKLNKKNYSKGELRTLYISEKVRTLPEATYQIGLQTYK